MFIKKDHYNDKTLIILMEIVVVFLVVVIVPNITIKFFIVLLILGIGYAMYKSFNKLGIYVGENEVIIKKVVGQKSVDFNDIKAISIVRSVYRSKYSCVDLKDSCGKQLYTIILLNDFISQMENYQHGDFTFCTEFNQYIIGSCVYNQSFIDYLTRNNPKLKINDNRLNVN